MYHHHHSQQQGPQPFPNGPRPPHHQPPPNQHQNHSPSNMLSQVMGFQFPRPTQLPDELESALAIRGARDMDHRLMDHMNRPNQHQNQGSGSGVSQHGGYSSNPITLTSDNQPSHQQGVDWSNYQPPTKLFASPQTSTSHQSQRHQAPQQQPQSSHAGTNISSWTAPANDSLSPQARHPHGGGSGGSGDGQALYTPESAGSILASFGLSNEDLEVLSHYPDDQLTPDTLPFILRDIQINKSGSQKTVASSSSFSRSSQPLPPSKSSPLARSRSPEVPSLLTVTQTAGKVIDYGHASRAKDESSTRETFKREPLSSERTVKMYPSSLSSSSAPKLDKAERRQVRMEHSESSKHGDQDYRRTSSDIRKSHRSPGREFPPSSKPRNLDRDYRRDGPKSRPSSETKSDSSSRRSLSSTSGSKPHSSNKKLPTPTMISDFSAVSPKAYPHTCSLCHTQCEQEKDWIDHVNTVNHTAACRDLRNKYPDWKPNLPRYGSPALWDPKDHSPSHSVSRSLSGSPHQSPPRSKRRTDPHLHWRHPRPYSPHRQTRHQHYTEHQQLECSHSGSRSPSHSYRTSSSSREHRPEKRDRESSVGSSRSGGKRPHDDTARFSADTSRHLSSSKAGHGAKHGPLQSTRTGKSWTKPGTKPTKTASAKASDTSAKLPPTKKKKKIVTPACKDWSVADRLVYLTGIPKDASEQEVTDLVGSFGKINNVILMPCSEEESEKGEGQKASVCMVTAEDTNALASSTNLSIRDQQITASTAKKPEAGQSFDANSKPAPAQDQGAGEDHGAEADQKTHSEKGVVLITGFPESGWSESDVIKLIQPFGTPSDIIQATQLGKVLVSVPDMEVAQEIVKVHSFMPAKMMESELKIIHLKQRIGLSTPVALYNLLMGSEDPLECPVSVGWSSLLVISNVPNTLSGSSEVQKLVRRFGTVIKTLVLNNMVICEMATAAMALSVYKRFQTFPCIIQNNPLFFSRKPDPKASTQTKVITACLDSSENTPANGKGSQAAAVATEEESAHKKNSEPTWEAIKKEGDGKDEKMTSTEKMVGEDKALGENGSKDDEMKKDELTFSLSDDLVAPDSNLETDVGEKPAVVETAEETKVISASMVGNEKTIAGEETKQSSSEDQAASLETARPELPQVTQEMVNALLVECRTRTASHPTNTGATTNGEQEEIQGRTEKGEKAAEETQEPDKKNMEEEEEEEGKKQETERKEREARKEKEARERERREKERRAWEKVERAKRERDERARRERRERERRQRKRPYVEGFSGSRTSCRLEGNEKSSWRDEQHNSTVAEDEEFDFPFNMSDFVTVDEVGDVADLPSPPPPPSVPMETTERGEDSPTSVQHETSEHTPMEVSTETLLDAPVTLIKSDEHESELESADTSDLTPSLVLTAAASPSLPSQAELSPGAEITLETEATLESTPEIEPLPAPAAASSAASDASDAPADSSIRPETVVTLENEKEGNALSPSQAQKEEMMLDGAEEKEQMPCEEDKETATPAVESGTPNRSDDKTNGKEESLQKEIKEDTPMSTDCPLPPFDPNNPVGIEFLVPKTGFFCKVCNRFFSGTKEAEISHCKTLKHYENWQKFMRTRKPTNEIVKLSSI